MSQTATWLKPSILNTTFQNLDILNLVEPRKGDTSLQPSALHQAVDIARFSSGGISVARTFSWEHRFFLFLWGHQFVGISQNVDARKSFMLNPFRYFRAYVCLLKKVAQTSGTWKFNFDCYHCWKYTDGDHHKKYIFLCTQQTYTSIKAFTH